MEKESQEYAKNVKRHFLNPKFMGKMKNANAIAQVTNPYCGDTMKVYLKIKNNKIEKASFQTLGCGAAIASSDVACQLVNGKKIEEAEKLSKNDIIRALGSLPKEKIHCSLLGQDAIRKAIAEYKTKFKNNIV